MACNCSQKQKQTQLTTTCPKCNGYKTTKKGMVTCPICKNVFFSK